MATFFLSLYYVLIVVSALIGIYRLQHFKDNYFKVFPFYLLLIFILDYFSSKIIGSFNMLSIEYFCKIVIPIEFLFYYWFYYMFFDKRIFKNVALAGAVIYGLSYIGEFYVMNRSADFFWSTSYLVGGVVLLTIIIAYFYDLLTSDRILTFTKERFFYISLGLFMFYILSLPYYGLFNNINFFKTYASFSQYYYSAVNFSLCVMALLFGISFIWGTR